MKKPRIQQDDAPGGLTHNPFAALRASGGGDSPAAGRPASGGPASASSPDSSAVQEPSRRIVVQREKKGRGGKTVTRILGLDLPDEALTDLARKLKKALGCGASTEGADVLLQGALTERAAAWLREHLGVDVTIGN